MPANPIPIAFPTGGINENGAYASQPSRFALRSDHVLNVRPHDALERRARGGKRTGISKYFADAVNGSNAIQAISSAVLAFDPTTIVPDQLLFGEDFEDYPDGTFVEDIDGGRYRLSESSFFSGMTGSTTTEKLKVVDGRLVANVGTSNVAWGCMLSSNLAPGENYVLRARATFRTGEPHGGYAIYSINFRWNTATFGHSAGVNVAFQVQSVTVRDSTSDLSTTNYPSSVGNSGNVADGVEHIFECRVVGDRVSVLVDGIPVVSEDISTSSSQAGIGFAVGEGIDDDGQMTGLRTFEVYTGIQPASLRTTKIVAVSGGSIYSGTPSDGLEASGSGAGAVAAAGPVGLQGAFQKVYFCDGDAGGYQVLDLSDNTVATWTPTDGSLPVGSVDTDAACRIIALYRGRIVMTGLREEPQNWFMSKAGDPLNWDYSPTTTSAIQAVAGNNSNAGELGDIVTALMPYQDDLLFMGGDHTLWVMRGDPAAGGLIDNISRQVGVVGPYAWTWDTTANLYFLGQNGLYRLAPGGGAPELISKGKLDRFFANINTAQRLVRLIYDREWQGVHIFLTPQNEPDDPVDHIFWDERTNSFWRDQYPTHIGPTAVHLFDADNPDDRAVLMGGFDSYIRNFDDSVMDDDGTAVDSFVRFPLMHPSLPQGQFQLRELQINTDADGNAVSLDIYRGHTPEAAAVSSTSVFNKTLLAGRNVPTRKHLRANALQLRLRQTASGATWAYEAGTALIAGVGRVRAKVT